MNIGILYSPHIFFTIFKKVMKGIQQLLWQVSWDNLDILVIDMPPGTGDIQLSITQQVELSGKKNFFFYDLCIIIYSVKKGQLLFLLRRTWLWLMQKKELQCLIR